MTSQAPHVVRTVVSLLSGLPESKVRIISPDIGGGFGNKVGVYPGYVCAIVASIVLGRPVKWIEDRIENISTTAFARDYHMVGELAADSDGRITACACNVHRRPRRLRRLRRSDQVSRPACSTSAPAPTTSRRLVRGGRRLHQQGAGRRRLSLFVPRHRGDLPDRAHGRRAGAEAEPGQGRDPPASNFIRKEQFPYHSRLRLGIRSRRLSRPRCEKVLDGGRLHGAARRAGGQARRPEVARR